MTGTAQPAGRDVALCVALTALWAAFWWPVVSGAERLYVRDLPTFGGPAKYYWKQRVAAGELPAWIPSVDAGSPFLADVGYQALYPPNLLFLLDQPLAAGLSWFMALHFLAGMLGIYALARALGARPLLAGWAAGVYGLSGYPLGIADNITYVAGVAWAPWVLAAFFAGMRRRSVSCQVLAAVFLSLLLLAGDLLDAAAVCVVCGGYALFHAWRALGEEGPQRALALLMLAAVTPLIATLLAGAQVLPTLELLPLSVRAEGITRDERARWSLPPLRLVELLHPYVFGAKWPSADFLAPSLYPTMKEPWVESIYLGPAFLGCALAALWLRARVAAGWALLVAGSLLLSTTGQFDALLDFTARLPVLASQRYFEKLSLWACIGALPMALLGAAALLDAGREPVPRNGTARFLLAMVALLVMWLTLDLAFGRLPVERLDEVSAFWSSRLPVAVTNVGGPIVHALLWMPLLIGCLVLRGRGRRAFVYVALIASLLDLFWLHHGRYISAPAALVTDEHAPAAVEEILKLDPDGLATGRVFYDQAVPGTTIWVINGFIRERVDTVWARTGQPDTRNYLDIYNVVFLKERITPNYGIEHDVRYFNGDWSPLRLAETKKMERELLSSDPGLLLALGGVRWVVTAEQPRNFTWEEAGFVEAAVRSDMNLRLLRATRAAPRAWLSAREEVRTPAHDYLNPAGEARVIEEAPERLRIAVQAGEEARWLIVSESLLPGWRAWLDGAPVEPSLAHRRFIAVAVQPGAHEVLLEYRVPGLVPGLALSLTGLLCGLLLVLFARRLAPLLVESADAR